MDVLVVDDDRDILATIIDQLQAHGMQTDCARNGREAVSLASQHRYDVIVLDVMMPGMDGLNACQLLRSAGCTTPILFLTARDTLLDKIDGFKAGGDDYLVKPFAMEELLYRIHALSLRISRHQARQLSVGPLTMDVEQNIVQRDGQTISLNKYQFQILRHLMTQSPRIVSRENLESAIWHDQPPESDALRSHLYQLRRLIDKPFEQPLLKTIRGVGFCITDGSAGTADEA
ncbi:response regulator transcription factor [Gilvimarinus japonicus]|uniref:Response regulator transcription factor n=1 Tax=Gilvimarinus japonicus TaxID=1796469 RepID=A0ABV7HRZ4_9GAMM